jgi:DNA-binding transcriptional MocR family regulator
LGKDSNAELGISIEDIELNGPTLYGYPPLQEEIAAHCGVQSDSVVESSGTSMANFLALGALIEPGDGVLIEHWRRDSDACGEAGETEDSSKRILQF